MLKPWWQAVTPHEDIAKGRVNEGLFDAKLGQVAQGEGPEEYLNARLFLQKTCFTDGLTDLLTRILRRVAGERDVNGVLWLQTGFGGGKSHSELATYHLLKHPDEAMKVDEVASIVHAAGLERPPRAEVAVVSGTGINPLGRTTADGLRIRTLWGEVAYQLGGPRAYALVAENDASLLSPGTETLTQLLHHVGPCAILFDETLHYVDKVKAIETPEKTLADQTVAFLRELTDAVDAVPGAAMVVSLTASREDMLSDGAMAWLERLNEHVLREARAIRPVQRSEIHDVIRRRLFERVDEEAAAATAKAYRQLYASLGGLPVEKMGPEYERLIARSYPFHPELVSVLYERWGARTGFQETRDTLRFLALALQHLWAHRERCQDALIQCCDIDLGIGELRGMARRVAGDEQWETVIGTDVAAQPGSELAHAQQLDRQYKTGRLAEGLATTILLYSIGGGEAPRATREGLRLACTRPGVPESLWDDILARFERNLFYYYWEDSLYQFRKEPNVLHLHRTHQTNLTPGEVEAHLCSVIAKSALGDKAPGHGFRVYFRPEGSGTIPDDEDLKLIVLDPQYTVNDGVPSEATARACLDILDKRGDVLRQNRNVLVFCAADQEGIYQARQAAADYLCWSKIQRGSEWGRIGGAQQAIVTERMENASAATVRGLVSAYSWALLPIAVREGSSSVVKLESVRTGHHGPGKLIVPMVWERLTGSSGAGPAILTELTPEALLDRYHEDTWPRAQLSVTTRELWERFCRQVALPPLRDQSALLDTLRVGQQKGLFALGHLTSDDSPRDQRDSYTALYFKQPALPPQEPPQIGQRWVLLRPSLYEAITSQPAQVSIEEVRAAVRAVNGGDRAASVSAVYAYVSKGRAAPVDDRSFYAAVKELVVRQELAYRTEPSGAEQDVPEDPEALRSGWLSEAGAQQGTGITPAQGRVVTVSATLSTLQQLTALYKRILQPLDSQRPKALRLVINVTAEYETDPGGGLSASLRDGREEPTLRDLITIRDSKQA